MIAWRAHLPKYPLATVPSFVTMGRHFDGFRLILCRRK
jgi:hypothetical protein